MSKEKVNNEKMVVVERSPKWWLSLVAGTSLALGLAGGFSLGAVTVRSQQQAVQAGNPSQVNNNGPQDQNGQNQAGPGAGNRPPQDFNGEGNMGPGNGNMPPQGNGNQAGPEGGRSKNKKPANADGTTKEDNSQENNQSKTTNS
ncbi:hypothetical protein [Streptococcus oricebi]|uniref:Uncharacterized protein n=1 Tax=Streptococcus oricebi TaxID=1547447 RepID=A0ABS5B2V9_9STRE|nr:hypothetical protein [Streptococcus oricebi]MBP2623105.1 hypothetical protein [Streptococcus oricebi]